MPKKYTDSQIIEKRNLALNDIKKVVEETNNTTFKNYKKLGKYSECFINTYLTNWNTAMSILDLNHSHIRNISKEDVLADIRNVFKKTSNTTRENYLLHGKYSRAPINRLFGNWNNMLKEINVNLNMVKSVSRDEILEDVIKVLDNYGDEFSSTVYRKHGKYCQSSISNAFGNWTNLLLEIGVKKDGRYCTDDEIIEDIRNIYKMHNVISKEIIDANCIVSSVTIRNRFGNIKSFLNDIGIDSSNYRRESKYQQYVQSILENVYCDKYVLEKTFDWLRFDKTGCKMRIDIFLYEKNMAIEVDGPQHYNNTDFYSTPYELVRERDECKNKLLKEKGIKLLRIPPRLGRKRIEGLILDFLK